jgi:hypothetical protein
VIRGGKMVLDNHSSRMYVRIRIMVRLSTKFAQAGFLDEPPKNEQSVLI